MKRDLTAKLAALAIMLGGASAALTQAEPAELSTPTNKVSAAPIVSILHSKMNLLPGGATRN